MGFINCKCGYSGRAGKHYVDEKGRKVSDTEISKNTHAVYHCIKCRKDVIDDSEIIVWSKK